MDILDQKTVNSLIGVAIFLGVGLALFFIKRNNDRLPRTDEMKKLD